LAGEGVVGAGVGEESGFQGVSITRKAGGGAPSRAIPRTPLS
jgi:hypothetical protein